MIISSCIKVFLARIIDVSLGVLRTVELVKNNTSRAAIIAFFEVFIWLIIAREALTDNNIFIMIFYSLGYAFGTLIGVKLSYYFSTGTSRVEVITNIIKSNDLKKLGYGVSSISMDNKRRLLLIEVNKKNIGNLLNIINKLDNKAFITINETKLVYNGFIK